MAAPRKPNRSSSAGRSPQRRKPPVRKASTTGKRKPSLKATEAKMQELETYEEKIRKHRSYLQGDRVFVLDAPWEARAALLTFGAKHHSGLKVVTYQSGVLRQELKPYASLDYSYERWVEDDLNMSHKPVEAPAIFMKPRPHQVTAIKKIGRAAQGGWRGFVLADNVGVGKTLSAIIGASVAASLKGFSEKNPAKMVVICPKSAIPHWRNSIRASGVKNLRVLILNYDQSKKLLDPPASVGNVKKAKTKAQHTNTNGKPSIKWDIIIADESHKVKNLSQRTAAFTRIARYSAKAEHAPFVIWASATIGQSPLELAYLAPLIGQMHGVNLTVPTWGDWLINQGFSIKKTDAGNFIWVTPKSKATPDEIKAVQKARQRDVDRLSSILFAPTAPTIRRNPEDIQNWPKQTHIPVPQELDRDERRLYNEIWNQFRSYLNMNPRGKNPKGGLAATLRFRQKASLLRVSNTVSFANDLLENKAQLLISVQFSESIDAIRNELEQKGWRVAEFSGRNTTERESERLRFQRGEADVIIFSVTEAVSFHAGELLPDGTHASSKRRETIMHDIRYSGLDTVQIMGRGTREGQLANCHFMYAEDTVESRILGIVLDKVKNMKTLSADDEETIAEIENLLDTVQM